MKIKDCSRVKVDFISGIYILENKPPSPSGPPGKRMEKMKKWGKMNKKSAFIKGKSEKVGEKYDFQMIFSQNMINDCIFTLSVSSRSIPASLSARSTS